MKILLSSGASVSNMDVVPFSPEYLHNLKVHEIPRAAGADVKETHGTKPDLSLRALCINLTQSEAACRRASQSWNLFCSVPQLGLRACPAV